MAAMTSGKSVADVNLVLELNELVTVTPDVVAAARESLVIGAN